MLRHYWSPSTGGFYDTDVHGPRTIQVLDSDWTPPIIPLELEKDGRIARVDGPDPDAQRPLIETANPHCRIPADAVEISGEKRLELLDGVHNGKRIVATRNGKPRLAEPPPATEDQVLAAARAWRQKRLAASDWTQFADAPLDVDQRAQAVAYRQALRDWPSVAGPGQPFPTAPDFLK